MPNQKPVRRLSLRIKFLLLVLFAAVSPILIFWILPDKNLAILVTVAVESVLLIVGFLLTQMMISQIKRLETALLEYGKGNFGYRLDVRSNDEVEEVADNFLAMQTSLNQFISAIQHEKDLISAERSKLFTILEGITEAVIVVDVQRNIVLFNRAAEALTGFTEKEAVGKPVSEIVRIYEKDNEITPVEYCPIKPDFSGVVFSRQNLTIMAKKRSFAHIVSGQFPQSVNTNLGCILTLKDNTQEMELERMKLDFVSMAAHELRTPLTAIRGYLSLLIGELKMDDEHRQFLDRAMIGTMQLNDLVENLLSVSKIERGSFAISKQPLDWVANTEGIVSDLTTRAKEKTIDLKFEHPTQTLPSVQVDKLRINEVLNNLIVNAINYTKPGGFIKVWMEVKDQSVVTHVTDNGQGIPPEALQHLFTKFFRVSGSLERGSKGTGLGLYITKSIVEMHGGKIWAESPGVNKGSTFSFSLPVTLM